MAEILGLTVADKPTLRVHPHWMTAPMVRMIEHGWKEKPHLNDPKNWPEPMQAEWGSDQGTTAGAAAQAHQVEQFRIIKAALDDFNPDFMVVLYREHYDVLGSYARFQYNIQAHEELPVKLFQPFGRKDNNFGEDPERIDTLHGHQEGALHLVRALQDRGQNPLFSLDPYSGAAPGDAPHPGQLQPAAGRHNLLALAVHMDWDRREFKTPIVPMGFDPFGFCRTRNDEGMSPWDRSAPRPLLPQESFELGRTMAQVFKASPWRVALVAGVDWSHANNSAWEYERIHPDIEADQRRFEQWKSNDFHNWGDDWDFEEMEEHGQWELSVVITLAGAMAELGAKVKYTDFYPTWCFNENFVNTVFEVK